ncbi:MAG: hypothetical protein KJP04_11405, partial [Arenicella sp.]|nr:hypothetical protein [Arenicella sp.]
SLLLCALLLLVVAVLAWGWFNSDIKPQSWVADANPGFTGKFARNGQLDTMRFIAKGLGTGPEDLAVAADGQLYTGVENGQIFSIDPATGAASLFAETAGRPLGMEFDRAGNLIVADANRGLLSINPAGDVSVLIDSATLRFADDLDIAADGTIWFSNASRRYGLGNSIKSFLEGDQSG